MNMDGDYGTTHLATAPWKSGGRVFDDDDDNVYYG